MVYHDSVMWLWLFLMFSLIATHLSASGPVFTVQPVSINTTDGSVEKFTCVANASTLLVYVNNVQSSNTIVTNKEFMEASETLDDGTLRANLTVTASSSLNNNSMIMCTAFPSNTDSDEVILRVQGPLSSVEDFKHSFISCYTINISWSPPFTLPGTDITGYNISATSNGTTTNYFTSNSYYELSLTDVIDSPCNEIIITVSGYNGLDGENISVSTELPSVQAIPVIILNSLVQDGEFFTIKLGLNVSSICCGQYPTHINLTIQYSNNGSLLTTIDNIPLVSTNDTDILSTDYYISTQLSVNTSYTVIVSFKSSEVISSSLTLRGSGIKYIVPTDTVGSSVEFTCHFYADSDAIGCRIELVLTNSTDGVQYTGTGNRIDDRAIVTIDGVDTEGEYSVSVYEIKEDDTVFPVILDIVSISLPSSIIASTSTATTLSSTTTTLTTSTIPPSATPSRESDSTTTTIIIIVVGVIVPVVVVAAVIVFVCCVVYFCKRKGSAIISEETNNRQYQANTRDSISSQAGLLTSKCHYVNPVNESMEAINDEAKSIPVFSKSNIKTNQQLSDHKNVLAAYNNDSDYLGIGQSEESSNKNDGVCVASGAAIHQDETTTTTTTMFCDEESTLLPPPKHSVEAGTQENAQNQQPKIIYADLDSVREQPPLPRKNEDEVIYSDVPPTIPPSLLPPQKPPKKKKYTNNVTTN